MLAGTTVGRYSLFAGGYGPGGDSDTVDIYDSETQTWSVTRLSQARGLVAATSFGSSMAFFAGGQFKNGSKSDVIDVFHAETKRWSTMKLSLPRSMLAAASADGPGGVPRYVLFGGGELVENEGNTSLKDDTAIVDILDVATNVWSTANLSIGRKKFTAASLGRRAIFAGGYLSHFGSIDAVDIFDGLTGEWTTAKLSASRMRLESAVVADRAYFVSGMGDVCGGHCPQVDIYNGETGEWSSTNLTNGRYEHIAEAIGDTVLLVAGGKQASSPWNMTEVLDVGTDKWSLDFSVEPRSYHASAPVPKSAMVLMAGGDYANGTKADLVECFTFDAGAILI